MRPAVAQTKPPRFDRLIVISSATQHIIESAEIAPAISLDTPTKTAALSTAPHIAMPSTARTTEGRHTKRFLLKQTPITATHNTNATTWLTAIPSDSAT